MRFMRVGEPGSERPVVENGRRWFDISSLTADIDKPFWTDGPDRVARAIKAGVLPAVSIEGQRVGAPIARPGAVVCIGLNFSRHAAESGVEPPEHPIVFLKPPNTVTGPYDTVTIPPMSVKTDWEVELGVVIGRTATFLDSEEAASQCIAGFVLVNDLSERTYQLEVSGGQWSKGKAIKGFTPTGPVLVTPDEINPACLGMRSWVNGHVRQNSTTADMIFNVGYLLRDLSQYMELEPGDLVITGTPEGVALSGRFPYLGESDVVEVEIDGLGRQRQTVTQTKGSAS